MIEISISIYWTFVVLIVFFLATAVVSFDQGIFDIFFCSLILAIIFYAILLVHYWIPFIFEHFLYVFPNVTSFIPEIPTIFLKVVP